MASGTICSDFGAQGNKICHCFHFFPICHEVMGLDAILVFWMLSTTPAFLLSSFTLMKRIFSSSSLFTMRVVSSACLKLLIFLLAILFPACDSFSLPFHVMYSAFKLKKQSDNIQPCYTPFPILKQSIIPCSLVSWLGCGFLRRQVRWSVIPSL